MIDRLVEKIDFGSGNDCWLWTASKDRTGYGKFMVSCHGRVTTLRQAHRVVYEQSVEPIPDGLTLDHLCRNRACVNPDHLEPVTNRENLLRGVGPSAQAARNTHCKNGHPYTEDNIYRSPGKPTQRRCRVCLRAQWRAVDARRRTVSLADALRAVQA